MILGNTDFDTAAVLPLKGPMDRLTAMEVFRSVATLGSFAGAARALRLSPAAVTRAVAQLEARLGVPLLNRTTRVVRLTEAGAAYLDRCRAILAEIDAAERQAAGQRAAPGGQLSLTAPVVFGRLHVMPAVEAMLAAHPALTVRLVLLDRVTHLLEEGFDAALRIGPLPDSSLIATTLGEVRRVVVASPAYLARAGVPTMPADLRGASVIAFDGLGTATDWRFGGKTATSVTVAPRLTVNTADAAIDAALRGFGITRALSYQVTVAIAEGHLVEVLADHAPDPVPVSVVYLPSRRGSASLAAFIGAMRSRQF